MNTADTLGHMLAVLREKKLKINAVRSQIRDFDRSGAEMHDAFDEYLDVEHKEYELLEHTFLPSDILKSCDPIAYDQEYYAWLDNRGDDDFPELKELREQEEALEDLIDELVGEMETFEASVSEADSAKNTFDKLVAAFDGE